MFLKIVLKIVYSIYTIHSECAPHFRLVDVGDMLSGGHWFPPHVLYI